MTLIAIMLSALVAFDDSLKESGADPPAATAGEKEPKRLQKKDTTPAEEKKPAADERPTVESRGIPEPDIDTRQPDLDEELDKGLGKELEASNEDQDPLTRIAENMRDVEELLARMEQEEKSVEIQQKVVRELEDLLKQAENPPPPNPSSKNKNAQAKGQKKQMQSQQRSVARSSARPRPAHPTERTGPPRSARERPRETPEERDVWGHLSDMLRAEMSQYAKENFLAKYRDVIERYYTDISRRSSRVGD